MIPQRTSNLFRQTSQMFAQFARIENYSILHALHVLLQVEGLSSRATYLEHAPPDGMRPNLHLDQLTARSPASSDSTPSKDVRSYQYSGVLCKVVLEDTDLDRALAISQC